MELMSLMQARSNEVASIIGTIEAVDTSITTVIGTQAYNFPTEFEFLVRVTYDGTELELVDPKQWNTFLLSGVFTTGVPGYYSVWNHQLYLFPTPTAAAAVVIYGEKRQGTIDETTDTINLPTVLHARMLDGVIADMAAKDENIQMAQMYESKWVNVHIPAFYTYKAQYRRRGKFSVVKDASDFMRYYPWAW